jgi:hypothetical protein
MRRGKSGPAFSFSDEAAGPPKLEDVRSLAVTARRSVYWAGGSRAGIVTPANADAVPAVAEPVVSPSMPRASWPCSMAARSASARRLRARRRAGDRKKPEPLQHLEAIAQLSNGDWLIMDADQRGIHRFSRNGPYVGPFAAIRVTRLAVSPLDEVAGIDRDQEDGRAV